MHNFLNVPATYTDLYQLAMASVYFRAGRRNDQAVFDYFFRKLPFGGGFVVFAGLSDFLQRLETYRFGEEDLRYLRELGMEKEFLTFLQGWRFQGDVYSVREGDVVFPNAPIVRVEGSLIDAQLIETFLLNQLNFQSLIATKAARMRLVAGDLVLSEFGLRRAQGIGGYHATRAALIGGFDGTSNVKGAIDFDFSAAGTMAHAFIQSYDDELTAFRDFANGRPHDCILLVDTYNTLQSGIPNAIRVAGEMRARGHQLKGIRLDSGDLAYLAKASRRLLDDAGFHDVKIVASNQLDEWVIKSLLEQGAPIDVFGVGTSLATGAPDAALDGVYKLCFSGDKPRIKISETLVKTTLPDRKQVLRMVDRNGQFAGADAVVLAQEEKVGMMIHPFEPQKRMALRDFEQEPLLRQVMRQGEMLDKNSSLPEIRSFCRQRLGALPPEYKRFQYPHLYKVGISPSLLLLRDELKSAHLPVINPGSL